MFHDKVYLCDAHFFLVGKMLAQHLAAEATRDGAFSQLITLRKEYNG